MVLEKISWIVCYGKVTEERIEFLQEKIGIKFPHSFVNLIKECDGGVPKSSEFYFYDEYFQSKITACVGGFLNLSSSEWSDFLNNYLSSPEFFPEGLIAFAEDGGGDFICFDYRKGKNIADPPIVYWSHEADIGKDISFVANNFEEFIEMLEEPRDYK